MKEKILVVDDDPAIIRIVGMILEKQGYDLATAQSGEEAFHLALSFKPDLVILDVKMPGGWSGFETCQRFKTTAELATIPIIFLTAKAEQFEEGFKYGGADYILKPFNQNELIVRSQFHLKMRRLVNEVQQANTTLENKVQARTQDLTETNKKLNQLITERKHLENRLKHEAQTDFLTQLPSGVCFENELQGILDDGFKQQQQGALLFVDICHFEAINERFGWEAGDHFLINISKLLRSQLGASVLIGRIGGDQFAIYLTNSNTATATTVARGLVACVSSFSVPWQSESIQASICIGFCMVNSSDAEARKLVAKAIHASVVAKEHGNNSVIDYATHEQQHHIKEIDVDWSTRIQKALEAGNFAVFYQQVTSLRPAHSKPLIEILLRLKNEESDRYILPNEFFQFSPEHKLKSKIDLWVIRQVIDWLAKQPTIEKTIGHVSINLTSETLADPMFLITVENLLLEQAVPPERLCFEISEPDALFSIERTRAFLARVQSIGCKTCLDNFGGQIGIFKYLNELAIDYLKIDGSLLRDFTRNPTNKLVCEMLINIARHSDKVIIAAHVEEQAVADQLSSFGFDYAQGYFFHEPQLLSKLNI